MSRKVRVRICLLYSMKIVSYWYISSPNSILYSGHKEEISRKLQSASGIWYPIRTQMMVLLEYVTTTDSTAIEINYSSNLGALRKEYIC